MNGNTYEIGIPYSDIGSGATAAETVNIYILYGKDGPSGGLHSVYPPLQDPLTVDPLGTLTNAAATYTLE